MKLSKEQQEQARKHFEENLKDIDEILYIMIYLTI